MAPPTGSPPCSCTIPTRRFRSASSTKAPTKRYLTGSDFDLESFQPIGDKFWIAEEFGPYLIRTDKNGKVEAVFETMIDGKAARSPDHYAVTAPAVPGDTVEFQHPPLQGL